MNYKSKAKDSFKTKLNLFIYERVITDTEEFSLEDFKSHSIKKEIVHEYASVYWQEKTDFQIRNKTIKEIEKRINILKKEKEATIKECEDDYITKVFPKIFPITDFEILRSSNKCYYCDLTPQGVIDLANNRQLRKKNFRGWNLEIDRLDSNYEYTLNNCVMCCYWCNNAKTDEFTPTEFKEIGKQIRKIWEERLGGNLFGGDSSKIRIVKADDN